jgi:hypothetical protein
VRACPTRVVILVPVHRPDDAYVRFGCHERRSVGVVVREVAERAAGHLVHLRVILVPVHRAGDAHVRFGCPSEAMTMKRSVPW